ncbi:ABC transporter permease [Paenibacillus sp. OV219]|uniref:ABC transporter permease n=1 Tax=Paenibacillus sp. OV219 TaxID=1884377 RepID=UPI0008B92C5D|nr:ABC transporter permease subunit [Paenibacillus sp. OV219]SEO50754.1 ABC-2 family transporter protein [Paenibacillus sp. OV219]
MSWIVFAGKELLRKRILPVTFVLSLLFASLFTFGVYKISTNFEGHVVTLTGNVADSIMLMTLGLLFSQMIIAFFILFTTMGAISGEIENGLMLAVLSRPIARWRVYLGKYVGYAFWLVLYSGIMFFAILLPVHYLLHFPIMPVTLLKTFLLFIWIPMLLLGVSMLGSTYLPMLGNGVACAMLYGLSMFSGFAENIFNHSGENELASRFAFLLKLLMPSNALLNRITFELLDGLELPLPTQAVENMGPFAVFNVPSGAFALYTLFYLIVILALGCRAFRKKDIA